MPQYVYICASVHIHIIGPIPRTKTCKRSFYTFPPLTIATSIKILFTNKNIEMNKNK